MPQYALSFYVPKNVASIPFILEDIYFKGGLRVLKDEAARDAIPLLARKEGMLVVTTDSGKIWQLEADRVTYKEFQSGGGKDYVGVYPISVLVNGDISIDLKYLVPQTGSPGDFLVKDSSGNPVWKTIQFNEGSMVGNRFDVEYKTDGALSPLLSHDFELNMSQTILMLNTKIDIPEIRLEGFSTKERDETNPYTFVSKVDHLSDDGSTIMSDDSIVKGRRYNVLANLESPALSTIYWRITNLNPVPVTPTLTFTYLVIQ